MHVHLDEYLFSPSGASILHFSNMINNIFIIFFVYLYNKFLNDDIYFYFENYYFRLIKKVIH